ncbi:DUF1285 domain-containing protein [Reinekea forsetii]|uniref:DUF1285 domain-containing protein n=1 Tax=Reinekea forsetii TaxID=1336806 RepID=UPI00235644BC|nr:DUF1285 domain-containing protein [Reinekea forsetii]
MIELTDIYRHINNQTVAPVELWDPDFCGDIDLEIRRDGRWYYQGSLIARERMVKLFASVLKKEDERYFLVTPVEKVGIRVAATPFVVVSAQLIGDTWIVTNNLGDQACLDRDHPLKVDYPAEPEMLWRANLSARISPSVMYQWQIHALDHQGLRLGVLWLDSAGTEFMLDRSELT